MPTGEVSPRAETRSVDDFLTSAGVRPSALLIAGEAGIGKTTLWSAAVKQARVRGFRVLSARPAAAESVLAYAVLADLVADVEQAIFAALPYPQRHAIDRVLLRADGAEPTDQRAVAAGFLSIVERLAERTPVLVAIDDVQWLDHSSRRVLAFAVRRLVAPAGMLAAVRTDPDGGSASWLTDTGVPFVKSIQLAPLTIGGLHAVVYEHLGRSYPRPTMARIHDASGGNPFYALELARAMADRTTDAEGSLPSTLTELVRARIGSLDDDVHDVLLAAACAATPTVELLALATNTNAREVVRLLENAEGNGIVAIDGIAVSFTHPLLARGVYADAAPARRRAMHHRLAEVVAEREPAARHLALAATAGDPHTWASLDEAAELARMRGAPAAAAELVDLAVKLGGDTPQRRIRSASHHFEAGDPGRARAILEKTIAGLRSGPSLAAALCLLAMVRLTGDSFLEAIGLLERGLDVVGDADLALRVQMLVTLCFARGNVGLYDAAAESADAAVADGERLGHPLLLSQALGMQVVAHVVRGDGLDARALQRALEFEDPTAPVPLPFRASLQNAVLQAWTGHLDRAHHEILAIRRRCIEHGEENELMFLAFHGALIEIWRGDFAEATQISEDATERARLLGGDLPLFIALTIRAAVAAYAGRVDDARADATDALQAGQRSHSTTMLVWPDTVLGFLEVSRGDYAAAVAALEDQIARLSATPDGTEVVAASFVPDAIEALVQLDRLAEAEALIEALEGNGARLDRAWMLAVGGRCRAMLLAARGDLEAANVAVRQALVQHARLPMPFESARTQLLLGQIQRRQRRKDAANATLQDALAAFERMGTPLWGERVRAELARCVVVPRRASGLTPAERRVAELAAAGMTTRDVAAALFISPKTVEVNLSRIYRKLGIRSRAELGRHMGQPGS